MEYSREIFLWTCKSLIRTASIEYQKLNTTQLRRAVLQAPGPGVCRRRTTGPRCTLRQAAIPRPRQTTGAVLDVLLGAVDSGMALYNCSAGQIL
jgi:hypothetical protein